MIWLSNSTVSRLRDRLQDRGQRPSLVAVDASSKRDADAVETRDIAVEYEPLCEAMYLMMSADGAIGVEEREVLKGAVRNLSGDTLRGAHLESMLEASRRRVLEEGREKRLSAVVSVLREDKARAEVAFVLAAAVAFADNAIADEENETLNALAEGLGIDEARANVLLDDVEKDLTTPRPGE